MDAIIRKLDELYDRVTTTESADIRNEVAVLIRTVSALAAEVERLKGTP